MVELIAAIAGAYYYFKTKDHQIKIFVWYLWLTVAVETIGMYGYLNYNNFDNTIINWIKNSVFSSNTWLYNTYYLASSIVFALFYLKVVKDHLSKNIIKFSVLIYVIFTIAYYIISGTFFTKSVPYDILLQTLLVFIYVMLYYKQLLKSDRILYFYKLPIFYISSGLLFWYLCVTPLFIFDAYLNLINADFIKFQRSYLLIANTLLYSCYTFGFLYTVQYKKH